MSKDLITINVWIDPERSTDKAFLVTNALDKTAWLPRSQVKSKEPIAGKENKFRLGVPEWLYNKIQWKG